MTSAITPQVFDPMDDDSDKAFQRIARNLRLQSDLSAQANQLMQDQLELVKDSQRVCSYFQLKHEKKLAQHDKQLGQHENDIAVLQSQAGNSNHTTIRMAFTWAGRPEVDRHNQKLGTWLSKLCKHRGGKGVFSTLKQEKDPQTSYSRTMYSYELLATVLQDLGYKIPLQLSRVETLNLELAPSQERAWIQFKQDFGYV